MMLPATCLEDRATVEEVTQPTQHSYSNGMLSALHSNVDSPPGAVSKRFLDPSRSVSSAKTQNCQLSSFVYSLHEHT